MIWYNAEGSSNSTYSCGPNCSVFKCTDKCVTWVFFIATQRHRRANDYIINFCFYLPLLPRAFVKSLYEKNVFILICPREVLCPFESLGLIYCSHPFWALSSYCGYTTENNLFLPYLDSVCLSTTCLTGLERLQRIRQIVYR